MSSAIDLDARTRPLPTPRGGEALARPGPTRRALADAAPLIVGYLPFGLILGARLANSTLPALVGWLSSPLVFAGAAQLAMVDLLDAGAAPAVVVATAMVINARLVVYSGAFAPLLAGASRRIRLLVAALLTDPVYALATIRLPGYRSPAERTRYVLTLGAALWLGWLVLTAMGMAVGGHLPQHLPLDLAVPLTFLALVVPTLTDRATLTGAITAGVVAVLVRDVPLHLGLLLAAGVGILAGTLVTVRTNP